MVEHRPSKIPHLERHEAFSASAALLDFRYNDEENYIPYLVRVIVKGQRYLYRSSGRFTITPWKRGPERDMSTSQREVFLDRVYHGIDLDTYRIPCIQEFLIRAEEHNIELKRKENAERHKLHKKHFYPQ